MWAMHVKGQGKGGQHLEGCQSGEKSVDGIIPQVDYIGDGQLPEAAPALQSGSLHDCACCLISDK
jgi:hypothetical protein